MHERIDSIPLGALTALCMTVLTVYTGLANEDTLVGMLDAVDAARCTYALLLLLDGGAGGAVPRVKESGSVCAGFKPVLFSWLPRSVLPTVTGCGIDTRYGLRDGGDMGSELCDGMVDNTRCAYSIILLSL